MPTLLVERLEDGVIVLTLNRPKQQNAMNHELAVSIASAFREISSDPTARCVVLRGSGKHFCSGADLTEAANGDWYSQTR